MTNQNQIKAALDAVEYLMKWAGKELTITGTAVMKDKIVLIYSTLIPLAEQPIPTGVVGEAIDSQELVNHLKEQLTDLRDKYLAAAKYRQEAEDELAAERAEKLEWNSACMKLAADLLAAESNVLHEQQAHEQTKQALSRMIADMCRRAAHIPGLRQAEPGTPAQWESWARGEK